jgi:hypothetical protein
MRYPTSSSMRWLPLLLAFSSAIACTYVQEFAVPNGPPEPDAGAAEASCASIDDPESCGVCGHSCLGGTCLAGVCQPVVLASGQGDSAFPGYTNDIGDPHTGPDRIAADEAYVYWLNLRGEVMRVPVAGGAPERLASVSAIPHWLVLDDAFVYFSTAPGDVYRIAKNGGAPTFLAPASSPRVGVTPLGYEEPYPVELTLSGGDIYWADGSGVFVCRVTGCAGAPPRVVISENDTTFPYSFAIDGAGVQFMAEETHADLDDAGSYTPDYGIFAYNAQAQQFLGVSSSIAFIELHGGETGIYALATTPMGVRGVAHVTPSAVSFLASGDAVPPDPRGLALDEDYVYWANGSKNAVDPQQRTASVVRCKKTGCATPEILADGQIVPRAVAVTQDAVFWTTGDGRVMKLAKPANPAPSTR